MFRIPSVDLASMIEYQFANPRTSGLTEEINMTTVGWPCQTNQ